jgi:hypothetical protein
MDELYGILTAYELRLGHENLPKGEAMLKVLKKTKNQKQKFQTSDHEEFDVEEVNFIKKLQKGSGNQLEFIQRGKGHKPNITRRGRGH